MKICPCGSDKKYEHCCKPYINGKLAPETAESLMRARYTAYTLCEIDFIYDTHFTNTRSELSKELINEWAESSQWLGLDVLNTKNGEKSDLKGIVEFKAYYEANGKKHVHHETSLFIKDDGIWYYKGWLSEDDVAEKKSEKIGRNNPCPCGSGKKYKKCCEK